MKPLQLSFSYLQSSACVGEGHDLTEIDRIIIAAAWQTALKQHELHLPPNLIQGVDICVTLELQPGNPDRPRCQRAYDYFKETMVRLGYEIADRTLPQNRV